MPRSNCSTISSAARPRPRTCSSSRPARAPVSRSSTSSTLDPLDRAASLALVASARPASEHAAIVTAAAGNPLYLRELARAAGSDAHPHCLLDAVRRETGSLDDVAAALLAGAAVAGDPFDPELAAAAAGLAPDAATVDALCARDIIRPTGNGRAFVFRHPLLRSCVYDDPAGKAARRARARHRGARRARRRARGAGLPRRALWARG